MDWSIQVCTEKDCRKIVEGLVAYNFKKVPMTQEKPMVDVNRKIIGGDGALMAGCLAEVYGWSVACVEILWVDERYRGRGLGSALLAEVERIAAEAHCTLIHLDTFDFQAKDFYLRHGYEVFGVLEDCPEGHCRYYLKKKLHRRQEN